MKQEHVPATGSTIDLGDAVEQTKGGGRSGLDEYIQPQVAAGLSDD